MPERSRRPPGPPGDIIIALTYVQIDAKDVKGYHPKTVHVDADNRITSIDTAQVSH